jgi:hypothetical protein
MFSTHTATRPAGLVDLLHRSSDGVDVTLYYDRNTAELTLLLIDHNADRVVELDVPRERATYAFEHPFAFELELAASAA